MKRRLQGLYGRMKRAHLGPWASEVPERFHSAFVNVGGAMEIVDFHRRLLEPLVQRRGGGLRVLVVGVFGGRDFWGLRVLGHDVTGFDLNPAPNCPPTIVGDAEEEWPFEDASFDAVVICEVLEHLFDDVAALRQAHRVLASDGVLIGTVPFHNDVPDWHVRVHTPRTIHRLLARGGFEVDVFLERPGLPPLRSMNLVNHAVAAGWYALTRRSAYGPLLRWWAAVEWRLQRQPMPRELLCLLGGGNWGGLFCAHPRGEVLDHKAANRESFFNH